MSPTEPRWLALLSIACALALLGPLPVRAASLLLAGFAEGALEPVALRTSDGRFHSPPTGPALEKLAQAHFGQNTRYPFYFQGSAVAEFITQGFSTEGCFGFGIVTGRLEPPLPRAQERAYLAFSPDFPGRREFDGQRPLTPADRQAANALAGRLLQQHGLRLTSAWKLSGLTALRLDLGRSNGLSFSLELPQAAQAPSCVSVSLSVVAEAVDGRLMPRVVHFARGQAESAGCADTHRFVSGFEAESGQEYLLIEELGYESNLYEIYRRQASGAYARIYRGGGGAC